MWITKCDNQEITIQENGHFYLVNKLLMVLFVFLYTLSDKISTYYQVI